jgi:hypothetical protein
MKLGNWKTTVAGLLSVAPQLLHTFYPTVVTPDVANSLTGLFVALGLIAAQDGKNTPTPTVTK